MNADVLIGTVLGSCTLQQLIGQGGMGVVYLAHQSRPRRQVAVKVLLPATQFNPAQQTAFLERFRRETDAAASLEHPNILPVHEYGEREGLAYLVMPYVNGGTLREELERSGQLPLVVVVSYLDQLASALDFAHGRGVIHRDIKPANILKTDNGHLFLTDFGLVKIISDVQDTQVSLTGAGVPLGTPEYMSPEQVMGGRDVDARTDLYSLGVVLYQMVTGTTPFKGAMPMQVAVQHLQAQPVPPASLRLDLPASVEQVILRALAKNPDDRYASAQDLASAFRLALAVSGIQLFTQTVAGSGQAASGAQGQVHTPRGLFDPSWQTGKVSITSQKSKMDDGTIANSRFGSPSLVPLNSGAPSNTTAAQDDIIAKNSMTLPSFSDLMAPAQPLPNANVQDNQGINNPNTPHTFASNLPQIQSDGKPSSSSGSSVEHPHNVTAQIRPRTIHKTGLRRTSDFEQNAQNIQDVQGTQEKSSPLSFSNTDVPSTPGMMDSTSGTNSLNPAYTYSQNSVGSISHGSVSQSGWQTNSDTPSLANGLPLRQGPATIKLTQSFKVIQVPVAGQPGQFVTGFLPVLSQETGEVTPTQGSTLPPSNLEPLLSGSPLKAVNKLKKNVRFVLIAALIFLVLLSSSAFWLLHRSSSTGQRVSVVVTPNATATLGAQVTATMEANIILSDPLNANSHNWHVATSGPQQYVFKNNAYNITNDDTKALALALLPDETVSGTYVYSLTMREIAGDDSSITNQFGLVYNFSVNQKDGKLSKAFYIFEVANTKGGNYQLLKYNDGVDPSVSPWTTLWNAPYGSEFHAGHGPQSTNTFKVEVNSGKFTLVVNNKVVGKAQDNSLKSGLVGMLVNQNKTEVAFTKLLLTHE